MLVARVKQHFFNISSRETAGNRQQQIGSGMRGDKIRTVRVQDGVVTNHLDNKKMSFAEYAKGLISKLQ